MFCKISESRRRFWDPSLCLCLFSATPLDHCRSNLKVKLIARFLSPLSELYGRQPIVHAGNIVFTIFQIGCAEANSIGTLIVLRLFAGLGGSAILSVGGGIIADTFPREKMGAATASFAIGPLIGPVVGPVMYKPSIQVRLLMSEVDLSHNLWDGDGYTSFILAELTVVFLAFGHFRWLFELCRRLGYP